MNNNQSENKEPDFFTPNAPIKYAMAGGRGVMIGCGIKKELYVIVVNVVLYLGLVYLLCFVWAMVGVAFFCLSYHSS